MIYMQNIKVNCSGCQIGNQLATIRQRSIV
nr:MAG TPA_asm: hypothetical protein [Caudoviricetes sp.]